jgi:2-oxoglutarate ferredoxin oxidoreductase subunit alpha
MERLVHKFNTAKELVPGPVFGQDVQGSTLGLLYFGTTAISVPEAMVMLDDRNIKIDTMRIRAFPFSKEVEDFINSHEKVFLVEQNRDAQLRSLLVNECEIDPARIVPILNYDGFPITAKCIVDLVSDALGKNAKKAVSETVAAE